eukprot:gnl/TRDRNA2_/TRDRNA2_177333_c0_seq2.p2 gnl/TRDRNA2_/TRDRNA2_177333_c0~~gnl/TRDRNA2_/TRDRNA2_177333_c0_seq2.p2  ORF type:complete len:101 (+),score=23.86 gnl/TRDRNA2_/TRDRNA2_177333_c0_seq2:491-793(+)
MTNKSLSDELGPKTRYMLHFVEMEGNTQLCRVDKTEKGCTKKEIKFIEAWKGRSSKEVAAEHDKLATKHDGGKAKAKDIPWLQQRVGILKQIFTQQKKEL